VDVERDLDVLVAVAHVAIDAEDALDVHLALEPRLDAAELDAAVLRDRRNAGREAAREPDEHELDRRRAEILGRKHFRVIRLERELGLVLVLLAEAVEALHGRAAVGTVAPLASGTPGEHRGFGRLLQRLARGQQRLYVDSVIDHCRSHVPSPDRRVGGLPSPWVALRPETGVG